MRLTFIGNGNMAKSLIKGLSNRYDIEVIGRNINSLELLKQDIPNISIKLLSNKEDISDKNIILCVKPNSLNKLKQNLTGVCNSLYSVLAGVTLETLQKNILSKRYIRTMPNIASSYLKSMTTITGDIQLKKQAIEIFDYIGSTLWVDTQKELDIATALAGSGPAFLALIAEGLSDGAVNSGLKRDDANSLITGLFDGFATLIKNNNPSDIKNSVMSPAGTTACGYAILEKYGVRSAMIETIEKSYEKAIQLSKQ